MHRGLAYTLIFAAGAAIGSVVTWRVLDARYKHVIKEEEDAIRDYYKDKYEADAVKPEDDDSEYFVDELRDEARSIAKEYGYTTDENIKREDELMEPYVIEPDELGELEGYETETLIYYSDGILTDDQDCRIDNIDDVVGEESLTHFGEYEEDTVCVRNDRLKCDYEICRDLRKYSDVVPVRTLEEDE